MDGNDVNELIEHHTFEEILTDNRIILSVVEDDDGRRIGNITDNEREYRSNS